MTLQKGFLIIDPQLANTLAYQIRATQDFNTVIIAADIDKQALSLAYDLTGINESIDYSPG